MSDYEDEEIDIFAISRAAGDNPPQRRPQTSHFGAVDENVNLEFNRDEEVDSDDEGGTDYRDESYQNGAAATNGRRPSESGVEEFQEGDVEGALSSMELAEVADRLITDAGFRLCVYGIKNVKFVLTVGLGLIYVGIQAVLTSLLVPDIARDLCLQDSETGWIRIIIFVGIAFGAVFLGCISDLTSRRTSLMVSLILAGVFGIIAALAAMSHSGLLVCLVLNGFSIGGILTIALPYYTELLPREGCERQIASFMLPIIIGVASISLVGSEFSNAVPKLCHGYCFSNWRITLVCVSILPFLSALMIYLSNVPESPRLLMEHQKWTKAIEVLTKIYTDNFTDDDGETYKYKANELYRIGRQARRSKPPPAPSTFLQRMVKMMSSFFKNIVKVLTKPIGQYTDRLVICACAFSFGYLGWALWFPDFIKAHEIKASRHFDEDITLTTIQNENYTDNLAHYQYHNVTFYNVKFYDLFLRDVDFRHSTFQDCTFHRVVSEALSFTACHIVSSAFDDVDFSARLFHDSTWTNSSFVKRTGACASEEPFAPAMAYYKLFLSHIGGIAGVFLSSLLTGVVGTRFMFIASSIVAAIVVFFMLVLSTPLSAAIVFLFLQLAGMTGWCALCIHTMLMYPTGKRATALGLLICLSILCGLLGLGIVADLPFQTSEIAQTIVTSLLLLVAGVLMYTLPSVDDDLIK